MSQDIISLLDDINILYNRKMNIEKLINLLNGVHNVKFQLTKEYPNITIDNFNEYCKVMQREYTIDQVKFLEVQSKATIDEAINYLRGLESDKFRNDMEDWLKSIKAEKLRTIDTLGTNQQTINTDHKIADKPENKQQIFHKDYNTTDKTVQYIYNISEYAKEEFFKIAAREKFIDMLNIAFHNKDCIIIQVRGNGLCLLNAIITSYIITKQAYNIKEVFLNVMSNLEKNKSEIWDKKTPELLLNICYKYCLECTNINYLVNEFINANYDMLKQKYETSVKKKALEFGAIENLLDDIPPKELANYPPYFDTSIHKMDLLCPIIVNNFNIIVMLVQLNLKNTFYYCYTPENFDKNTPNIYISVSDFVKNINNSFVIIFNMGIHYYSIIPNIENNKSILYNNLQFLQHISINNKVTIL